LGDPPKPVDRPLPKSGVSGSHEQERKQYIALLAEKDARIKQLEKQVRRLERTLQTQLDE
jgi:hypothetical protein